MTTKPLRQTFSTDWFRDCKGVEEKDKRAEQVIGSTATLQVLAAILQKRLVELDANTEYDTPAWQFKIASDLGRKKELNYLLKLLTPVLDKE